MRNSIRGSIEKLRSVHSKPLNDRSENQTECGAKTPLTEKLAYIHNHWEGLQAFLSDGRVEIDN
ncbi:IS66 family transposase, partial [Paenochrobactrum sp. BZR 201-1]